MVFFDPKYEQGIYIKIVFLDTHYYQCVFGSLMKPAAMMARRWEHFSTGHGSHPKAKFQYNKSKRAKRTLIALREMKDWLNLKRL